MEQYRDVLTKREITWLIEAEDTAEVNLAIKKKVLVAKLPCNINFSLGMVYIVAARTTPRFDGVMGDFCAAHYSEMAVT